MKKAGGPAGSLVVDTATVAKYLKVSERTVRDYAKRRGLPKLRQDRYNLVDVRMWEIGRLRKEMAEQQHDQNRLTKYSADEREHRAELVRLRMEKMKGLLIDRKEIEREWIGKVVAVTGGLEMLAQRIAERLDLPGAERIVEEEVVLCRDRFAGKEEEK